MPLYVAESAYHTIEHAGRHSQGVIGSGGGKEKIYLHLVELDASELARLAPRVDDDGNKQHDRLALPGREDWWIALEGEKVWPGSLRPRIVSKCTIPSAGAPVPFAVDADQRAELVRLKALLA
jgi:hypothetical protein